MDIIVTLCYFILTSDEEDRHLLNALTFCTISVLSAVETEKKSWEV